MFNGQNECLGQSVAVVTTPWNQRPDSYARAQQLAAWFACPYVPRANRKLEVLFEDEGVNTVIVATFNPQVHHRDAPDQPLFFHPGMAQQRLLRLREGAGDRLLRVAGVQPGDVVVDATLGAGKDALVLAEGVGESGRVIAIESSWVLARLWLYHQRHPVAVDAALIPLLHRIQVMIGNHDVVLQKFADHSVDMVYFDPMFRRPLRDRGSGVEAARVWANARSLTEQAWAEAQRVARKCVVLKERPASGEFHRFGLTPDKPARVAYGVWWKTHGV